MYLIKHKYLGFKIGKIGIIRFIQLGWISIN